MVYNDRFSLVNVNVRVKLQWLQLERSENQQPIPGPLMRLRLLPTLAVSGVIEHVELDKGLYMVDKAGVGAKNEVRNDSVMEQTKNIKYEYMFI